MVSLITKKKLIKPIDVNNTPYIDYHIDSQYLLSKTKILKCFLKYCS